MPTTITSAGITFNDATSLTSGSIGTSNIANNAVTAAKLGTNEQRQICKAWANFDGSTITGSTNAASGTSITVTSGSNSGTWVNTVSWPTNYVGQIVYVTSIGGAANATLGGVNVATSGIQIVSVSGVNATIRLLGGNATSNQTINGNGTSSGWTYVISAIRSSYNVSSITKNGTGDYTVNFATPMADANYDYCVSRDVGVGGTFTVGATTAGVATGSLRVMSMTGPSAADTAFICVTIFGN